MTAIVNGLAATPTRQALLRAIEYDAGRIYAEANQVWDKLSYRRVTDQVRTMLAHEWIRALTPDEPRRAKESKLLVYYRLTDFGRAALRGGS